jgi:arsenate reductase (thioredoxin)
METVLFVCVHNSGRSQMAAAYFNKLAQGKACAVSAGTRPAREINPLVVEAMRQAGIDISQGKPRRLTPLMLSSADRIISMGCQDAKSCPAGMLQAEDWRLPDPQGRTLAEIIIIRDEIKRRVTGLIAGW